MRRTSHSTNQSSLNKPGNGPNGWRFNQSYEARQQAYQSLKNEATAIKETGLSTYFVDKNLTTDTHLAPTYGNTCAIKYYPRAPPNSPRHPKTSQTYQEDYDYPCQCSQDSQETLQDQKNFNSSSLAGPSSKYDHSKSKQQRKQQTLIRQTKSTSQTNFYQTSNPNKSFSMENINNATANLGKMKDSNSNTYGMKYPETRFDYDYDSGILSSMDFLNPEDRTQQIGPSNNFYDGLSLFSSIENMKKYNREINGSHVKKKCISQSKISSSASNTKTWNKSFVERSILNSSSRLQNIFLSNNNSIVEKYNHDYQEAQELLRRGKHHQSLSKNVKQKKFYDVYTNYY